MKKKKYLVFFMIAASMLLLFTGCNKGKYGEDTKRKSEETACSLVQTLAEGDYLKAASDFPYTARAEKEMDAQSLESIWMTMSEGKGNFKEIKALEDDNWDKEMRITAECVFEKGTADLVLEFDRTVKIKAVYPG